MNLAEAFDEVRRKYGDKEAVRRLAYYDSFLEGQLIDEFNKSRGTRSSVSAHEIIDELKIQRLKMLPAFIMNQPAPEKSSIEASPFTFGYFIDWLLVDEKYPVQGLADKLSGCLSELYKRDGVFPLSVYNRCYDLLIGLIPK